MGKTVYVSGLASERLTEKIEQSGYIVYKVKDSVGIPFGSHADLYYCRLGAKSGSEVFAGDPSRVGALYPRDSVYNAACTGRFFIHRLDITDPALLARAEELGIETVDVPQGYAKCSTVVVDEYGIITPDRGIRKACVRRGMDVLLVSPGHVRLEGYRYGFLGGASGRIDDTIFFEGDLSAHPDFMAISSFIKERGLDISYDRSMPLTDIGSIV